MGAAPGAACASLSQPAPPGSVSGFGSRAAPMSPAGAWSLVSHSALAPTRRRRGWEGSEDL
eukprot:2920847-Prymnesium_polylepis.1